VTFHRVVTRLMASEIQLAEIGDFSIFSWEHHSFVRARNGKIRPADVPDGDFGDDTQYRIDCLLRLAPTDR
jgi:hypothetical protein